MSESNEGLQRASSKAAKSHGDLLVDQRAMAASMQLFELSRAFPREETYSLTDQLRRSSRSVAANIAEAWRKRRYAAAFVAKLSDAESEAAETQVWIEYAVKCGYLKRAEAAAAYRQYDGVLATLVGMQQPSETWVLRTRQQRRAANAAHSSQVTAHPPNAFL